MALCRGKTADCSVDGVDVDQGGVEDRYPVDHLGDGCGCGLGGSTPLGIEGRFSDPSFRDLERNAREIPAGSPTRSTRKGTVSSRPPPALIAQVVLEELSIHPLKGRAPRVVASRQWISRPSTPARANRRDYTPTKGACPSNAFRSAMTPWGSSWSCRQVTRIVRQPSATRIRSRCRSDSNLAFVPWTLRLSRSTATRSRSNPDPAAPSPPPHAEPAPAAAASTPPPGRRSSETERSPESRRAPVSRRMRLPPGGRWPPLSERAGLAG